MPDRYDDAWASEDDDALSWAGDDRSPARPVIPSASAGDDVDADAAARRASPADGSGVATGVEAAHEEDEEEDGGRRLGAVALLALGILGGVYVLETVGWVSSAVWSQAYYAGVAVESGVIGSILTWGIVVAAVVAPALWAFLSWRFNRGSVGRMIAWLAVGAILLLPLPAILPVAGHA